MTVFLSLPQPPPWNVNFLPSFNAFNPLCPRS